MIQFNMEIRQMKRMLLGLVLLALLAGCPPCPIPQGMPMNLLQLRTAVVQNTGDFGLVGIAGGSPDYTIDGTQTTGQLNRHINDAVRFAAERVDGGLTDAQKSIRLAEGQNRLELPDACFVRLVQRIDEYGMASKLDKKPFVEMEEDYNIPPISDEYGTPAYYSLAPKTTVIPDGFVGVAPPFVGPIDYGTPPYDNTVRYGTSEWSLTDANQLVATYPGGTGYSVWAALDWTFSPILVDGVVFEMWYKRMPPVNVSTSPPAVSYTLYGYRNTGGISRTPTLKSFTLADRSETSTLFSVPIQMHTKGIGMYAYCAAAPGMASENSVVWGMRLIYPQCWMIFPAPDEETLIRIEYKEFPADLSTSTDTNWLTTNRSNLITALACWEWAKSIGNAAMTAHWWSQAIVLLNEAEKDKLETELKTLEDDDGLLMIGL